MARNLAVMLPKRRASNRDAVATKDNPHKPRLARPALALAIFLPTFAGVGTGPEPPSFCVAARLRSGAPNACSDALRSFRSLYLNKTTPPKWPVRSISHEAA